MAHIFLRSFVGRILVTLALGAPSLSLAAGLSDQPGAEPDCESELESLPGAVPQLSPTQPFGGIPGLPVKMHILPPPSQLGIGVLVERMDGGYALGRAPYTASFHATVVERLLTEVPVKRIVWMGELRYRIDTQGRLAIYEANETSNHYLNLRAGGLKQGDREIQVGNGVHEIPEILRAAAFQPIPYDDNNKHLVEELSKLPLTSDVRHSIGNSLANLGGMIRQLRGNNPERIKRTLELINSGAIAEHAVLIRHLTLNLIEEGRLYPGQLAALLPFLTLMEATAPDANVALECDLEAVATELALIDRTLATAMGQSSVDIYPVPLPLAK